MACVPAGFTRKVAEPTATLDPQPNPVNPYGAKPSSRRCLGARFPVHSVGPRVPGIDNVRYTKVRMNFRTGDPRYRFRADDQTGKPSGLLRARLIGC